MRDSAPIRCGCVNVGKGHHEIWLKGLNRAGCGNVAAPALGAMLHWFPVELAKPEACATDQR
jgi:hypothetical protein